MRRVVIKIGSNVLTRDDGSLNYTRISSIVDQIVSIRKSGCKVILVSSGAVACGRGILGKHLSRKLDPVQQRQLYSAVGQVRLIGIYGKMFREWGISVGQVLTMKENFSTRRDYLNQRACMEVMLDNGIIPIVNENDTVSVTELMFTDNDELSGLVASMIDADTLIILSSIDGLYNGSPKNPKSSVIRKVMPDDDLTHYISSERSGFGRGGMLTKSSIARKVADEGIRVFIANGNREDIICKLYDNPDSVSCTEFIPRADGFSSVKKWIAHSTDFTKGTVCIDESAEKVLTGKKAASLLLVGVTDIKGEFEEGDIIGIFNSSGRKLAIGKSAYNSNEAREMLGKHDCRPLVHYDYLYLL